MEEPTSHLTNRATDLTEAEKVKLRAMAADWDKYHLAVRMLAWLGSTLRYLIGLGIGIAAIWNYFSGHTPGK